MVNAPRPLLWLALALGLGLGCKPDLEGRASLVAGTRVLALRSVPAEAKPGSSIAYDALYVGLYGSLPGEGLDWALCNQRKSLSEPGSISRKCLLADAPALGLLGEGSTVNGMLPSDACETFGPTLKTPLPGEPSFRPVDADTTGGYYQPLRVLARADEEMFSVGMTRLVCPLGGATQEQAAEFNRRYRPNENPKLAKVSFVRADGSELPLSAADEDDDVVAVGPGERALLRANWTMCPTEPSCGDGICSAGETDCAEDCGAQAHGCTGSEPYVQFDTQARVLTDRREAIRVSWFATGGEFDHERTGQAESANPGASTSNLWTAPETSGDVRVWVVIRDDRGGVGWSSHRLRVE
jgi:hypothetical protein